MEKCGVMEEVNECEVVVEEIVESADTDHDANKTTTVSIGRSQSLRVG